jgi:hypothetical protein
MAAVLEGSRRNEAIAFLQHDDPEAANGIDLYSAFVLKVQIRKYFAFGNYLSPQYKVKMRQAFEELIRVDPRTVKANPPRKFWENSQDDCNTIIDCRNTENLRAMRETSIYLIAEEMHNEAVKRIYKKRLADRVNAISSVGQAEWDSPTYQGHFAATYLNLYDFAKDPEVKNIAQQALNCIFAAAALKYWHGYWNAPSKRNYGDGAQRFFWWYFKDAEDPTVPEADWIHALTSSYRPPAWIVAIAQKNFKRPVEVKTSKADYQQQKARYFETLYFGRTFQLGSLANGTAGDWEGFSLLMDYGEKLEAKADGQQAIAQYGNSAIWLGESIYRFRLPKNCVSHQQQFMDCGSTWIYLNPVHLGNLKGFVLEVGEAPEFSSFEEFRSAVQQRSQVLVSDSAVEYKNSAGKLLKLQYKGDELPKVWRDNQQVNWADYRNSYQAARELYETSH